MRLGILYNINRVSEDTAINLAERARRKGADVVLFSSVDEIRNVERLLVLGGDGTILHSAQMASALDIPLLGVNYGARGFLSQFEREEADEALEFILREHIPVIKHSMLEAKFQGRTVHCLNEVSLLRCAEGKDRAAAISVWIDGLPAGDFIADGLIVSTPTGSTAYSLSAGGSIMTPDCETFLLTPICAFSMKSRPIVCSDKSVLTLSVASRDTLLKIHGDGIALGEALEGDFLTISKSVRYTSFFAKDKGEFFRRLTKKIN